MPSTPDKAPVELPPFTSLDLPKSMQPCDRPTVSEEVISLRWQAALRLRDRLGSHHFYGNRALARRLGPRGEEGEKDYWYSLVRSLKVD